MQAGDAQTNVVRKGLNRKQFSLDVVAQIGHDDPLQLDYRSLNGIPVQTSIQAQEPARAETGTYFGRIKAGRFGSRRQHSLNGLIQDKVSKRPFDPELVLWIETSVWIYSFPLIQDHATAVNEEIDILDSERIDVEK